jgi:hypothetical protein
MDVQVRLAVFARCNDPHAGYLVRAVYGQQHWLGRAFLGSTWANHHFAVPNATNQDDMPH